MDWLKSALDSDSDEEQPAVEQSKETGIATTDPSPSEVDKTKNADSGVKAAEEHEQVDNDECSRNARENQEPALAPISLFSLSTASRKVEDYSKTVEIKPIQPLDAYISDEDNDDYDDSTTPVSHDHHSKMATAKAEAEAEPPIKTQGNLDTSEIMQCFNMIHTGGNIKAPKQRDWFGANIRVTDINADDLRMDRIEKSKQYSMSKAALLEGRPAYKGPTRVLETDDGQLLATNVLRKTSKRKHQISWLAAEAQERELELLERTAQAHKTKHETQMKYGW